MITEEEFHIEFRSAAGLDVHKRQTDEKGHPQRLKASVVKGFRKAEIRQWAARYVQPAAR